MTRIPIATDLKTRTGAPSTKDAKLVNSYVEVKGEQSVVRKRPAAQGGIALGTGTAQGGIGLTIGGTPYFFGLWGDTLQTYTGSGTTYNSSTVYVQGDHVSYNFGDYWAPTDVPVDAPSSPSTSWSRIYVPRRTILSATPSGARISVSTSETFAPYVPGGIYGIYTKTYIAYQYGTLNVLSSGSGTYATTNAPTSYVLTYSSYLVSAADMLTIKTGWTQYPTVTVTYTAGYDWYFVNGSINTNPISGSLTGIPL